MCNIPATKSFWMLLLKSGVLPFGASTLHLVVLQSKVCDTKLCIKCKVFDLSVNFQLK